MSLTAFRLCAASLSCVFATSVASAIGPDWIEVGDAGSDFRTAQYPLRPQGATFLGSIAGSLASGVGEPDYEDLYFFRITDADAFTITTASATFNPVLYVFNLTVNNEVLGLLANDNETEETLLPRLVAASTDGTGVQITQPGDYLLAVTGAGRFPISRTGAMFDIVSPTEISGPDGVGGLNPLAGWAGEGETGTYRFVFTASDYPIVPSPGVVGILGFASLATLRRRRR